MSVRSVAALGVAFGLLLSAPARAGYIAVEFEAQITGRSESLAGFDLEDLTIRDVVIQTVSGPESWRIDAVLTELQVPEPGTALLLGLGLATLAAARRRG